MLRLKALLLALTIFANGFLFAQNLNEFVEVIVEDSISLAPQEIVFSVYIMPHYDEGIPDTVSTHEIKSGKENYAAIESALRNLIKKQNIQTIAASKWSIFNNANDYQPKLFAQLKFTAAEKLQSFIAAASKINGVMGFITSMYSSMENEYKQKLYKKLIEKARIDAGSLAGHAGRKLGSIIQVSEENTLQQNTGGWTAYPPLSALGDYGYGTIDSSMITIYKKLVVRFSW